MNLINILILLSLVFSVLNYVHKERNAILVLLLILAVANESLTLWFNNNGKSYVLNTTIYLALHNLLWYLILLKCTEVAKNGIKIIMVLYIIYSLANLAFFEGIHKFNFNTHIVGSLIYIAIFIYVSFNQLKKEKFNFFLSNVYLLLCAPILFFFGSSFVFGFKSEELAETTILGDIKLYTFIIYFVNIIYYTLINIYIYREKKLKHAG